MMSPKQNAMVKPAGVAQPDPQMSAVLAATASLNPKPIETLTPADARLQPTPSDGTDSYKANANAKPLNAAMMHWFLRQYIGDENSENPLVFPMKVDVGMLQGLPPATVVTDEIDPLRSEGMAYADKLRSAGVKVESRDYAVKNNVVEDVDETRVWAAVKKVAVKPSGNDGMICDVDGVLYTADFENNALRRVDPRTGEVSIVAQDERLLWPDTLALHDGWLYVTSNQLARQANYHFGTDERKPPYGLFRVKVGG